VWTKTPDSRGKLSARDVDTADLIMPPLWSRLRPRPVPVLFYPAAKRQICLTILDLPAIWPLDSGAIAVPLSRF
jgi:hypothetical protein